MILDLRTSNPLAVHPSLSVLLSNLELSDTTVYEPSSELLHHLAVHPHHSKHYRGTSPKRKRPLPRT